MRNMGVGVVCAITLIIITLLTIRACHAPLVYVGSDGSTCGCMYPDSEYPPTSYQCTPGTRDHIHEVVHVSDTQCDAYRSTTQ